MGIRLICIGLLFFANPNYGILDVIPDFIGCFLVLLGLKKLEFVFGPFRKAKRYFSLLFLVKLFEAAFSLLSGSFDGSDSLTIVTITILLSAFLFISGILLIYRGICEIINFYQKNKYGDYAPSIITMNERFKTLGITFMVVRSLLSFLPEIIHLQLFDSATTGFTFGDFDYSGFYPYASLICMLIVLAVGVVWSVFVIRFAKNFKKQTSLISFVNDRYHNEIEMKPNVLRCFVMERVLSNSLCFVIFGLLISFDHLNYFASVVSAIFCFLVLYDLKVPKIGYVISGLYLLTSAALTPVQKLFFADYSVGDVFVFGAGIVPFAIMISVELLKSASFIFLIYLIRQKFISQVSDDLSLAGISTLRELSSRDAENIRLLKRKGSICAVALCTMAVCEVLFIFFQPVNMYLFSVLSYLIDFLVVVFYLVFANFLRDYPYQILKHINLTE